VKIYLAGPMTGYDLWNFPAFYAATTALRAKGHTVWNPAEMDEAFGFDPTCATLPEGFTRQAMRRDATCICEADAIALLPGWEKSRGVAVELALANYLGLAVLDATTGEPMP